MQNFPKSRKPARPRAPPRKPAPARPPRANFPKSPRGGRETPRFAGFKTAMEFISRHFLSCAPTQWATHLRIKALLRPDRLRRKSHGAAPNFRLWRNYLPKAACKTHCRLKKSPLFSTLLPNGRKKKAADSRGLSKLHGGRDWIRTSERQSRTDLQSAPFSPLDTLPSCKLGFEHTLRDFRHKLFFQLF